MLAWTRHTILLILMIGLVGCARFTPQALDYWSVKTGENTPPMPYGVYTPPGWSEQESLPVILFLHGGGDNHTSFERRGANLYFDEQILLGNMPRAILVTPKGGLGLWENWEDGSYSYRDWVLDLVLPDVQRRYNTLECPEHCHLMGISMGGFGALRFAYFSAQRFSRVSVISAPIIQRQGDKKPKISWLLKLLIPFERIFGEDFKSDFDAQDPFNAWVNAPQLSKLRLQLIWGNQDRPGIRDTNRQLHQHLVENSVPHDAFEYHGNHKWIAWIPNLNRVVGFLVNGKYLPET